MYFGKLSLKSSPDLHVHVHVHIQCTCMYSVCIVLQCFEGMKAYRGPDGKVRLFRPMENMNRMKRSAVAASLPVSFSYALAHCTEYLWMCFVLQITILVALVVYNH